MDRPVASIENTLRRCEDIDRGNGAVVGLGDGVFRAGYADFKVHDRVGEDNQQPLNGGSMTRSAVELSKASRRYAHQVFS